MLCGLECGGLRMRIRGAAGRLETLLNARLGAIRVAVLDEEQFKIVNCRY
jgi:hypothetical protein